MKVIVAGSRSINNYDLVKEIIEATLKQYNISITELVHGGARGVDLLADEWARRNGIPTVEFPAYWNVINAPNAIVKTGRNGKLYNARAGFDRNNRMVEYGDVLIAIRKNMSSGTTHMINQSIKFGLKVFIKEVT